MKFYLIAMCLFLLSATPKKYLVKIEITQTSSYCGGAAPSEEMLRNLETPRAYAFKKVFLKKGLVNTLQTKIIKELTADSLGMISLYLGQGDYFIVDENKKDRAYYDEMIKKYSKPTKYEGPVDKECFDKWYASPELRIKINTQKETTFKLNFNMDCFYSGKPCIPYFGPVPP